MDQNRFAPASTDEETVYGASAPGWADPLAGPEAVEAWVDAMADRDVGRVCCLLSDRQVAQYDDLLGQYREGFGADRVHHASIPDHHLADPDLLLGEVFPFFESAEEAGERAVAHCLAGVGRTGHVLAAWLVYAREYSPGGALRAVEETGRIPRDAVRSGNATEGELVGLLEAVRE